MRDTWRRCRVYNRVYLVFLCSKRKKERVHMSEQERLSQIKARCDAATEGPWVMVHGDDEYSMNLYCVAPKSIAHKVDTEENVALDGVICGTLVQVPKTIGHNSNELNEVIGPKWEENADFIAHAREDVPFLLNEIERLNKMIGIAEDALDSNTLAKVHREWERAKIAL